MNCGSLNNSFMRDSKPTLDGSCASLEELRRQSRRLRWIWRIRPSLLAIPLARLLAPDPRRRIVDTPMGLRLYIDPLTHLGKVIAESGEYEPETVEVYKQLVMPGAVVLDIGANEGVFSALAAKLAGPTGFVLAVEPQSRLRDIIEINMRLNGAQRFCILTAAMGGSESTSAQLSIAPSLNSGSSSFVHRSRLYQQTEPVRFTGVDELCRSAGSRYFDLVKIDVEGFEHRVVEALLPLLRDGRIGALFVDYHDELLRQQGIKGRDVHRQIIESGFESSMPVSKDPKSYVLYTSTREKQRVHASVDEQTLRLHSLQ